MTTFDKREEGFEKKFAHDEDCGSRRMRDATRCCTGRPKTRIGRCRRRGLAKSVVMADFEEAGDDDVFRKVRTDLEAKGVGLSDHQIRRTMDELMEQAVAQIKAGS